MPDSRRNEKISAESLSTFRAGIPSVGDEMPAVNREMPAVTGAKLTDTDEISADSREPSARRDEMAAVIPEGLAINGEIPAGDCETRPVDAAGFVVGCEVSAVTRETGIVRFEMFVVK